jgi:hypothetical protein
MGTDKRQRELPMGIGNRRVPYCSNESEVWGMYIIIKVKDTDNIIGLKEDIAMRLEGIADIERIDVREEEGDTHGKEGS